MRKRSTILAASAAALILALTGCGSDGDGSESACKAAMEKQFEEAKGENGADAISEERPSACEGIDDETGQRLAEEVVDEQLGDLKDDLENLETEAP